MMGRDNKLVEINGVIIKVSLLLCLVLGPDGWAEEAVILPVPSSNLIQAHFQFSAEASTGSEAATHISPAIWQLVRQHSFNHLEVTLTRGHWQTSSPPPDGIQVPAPGLELKVAWKTESSSSSEVSGSSGDGRKAALEALSNSLSSLIGASVPSLVEYGVLAVPAVGWFGDTLVQRRQVFGALTQEGPCTESVSAWLKMLPCQGAAGLSSILRPERIVAAPFHALSLRIDATAAATEDGLHEEERGLKGINSLFNMKPSVWKSKVHLSLGISLLQKPGGMKWREAENVEKVLQAVLGGGLKHQGGGTRVPSCPASVISSVLLPGNTQDGSEWGLSKECTRLPSIESDGSAPAPAAAAAAGIQEARRRVSQLQLCSFAASKASKEAEEVLFKSKKEASILQAITCLDAKRKKDFSSRDDEQLQVTSWMTYRSPQMSQLSISIATAVKEETTTTTTSNNNSSSFDPPLLHILQIVPWEVSVRWHTLRLTVNGQDLSLTTGTTRDSTSKLATYAKVLWKNFRRAQPRRHAAVIELLIALPSRPGVTAESVPSSTTSGVDAPTHALLHHVVLKVEISKGLLTVFDYPPEASRGVDLPAASVALVYHPQPQPQPQLAPQTNTDNIPLTSLESHSNTVVADDMKSPPVFLPSQEALDSFSFFLSRRSLIGKTLGCSTLSLKPTGQQQDGHAKSAAAEAVVVHQRGSPLLLNLPIPDASMPFNVVCFTSTAIAVTFGSVLNALLKAPRSRGVGADAGSARRAIKMRLVRLVIVLLLVGCTAVYMDRDIQRKAEEWVRGLGLSLPVAPGGRIEL